jgi:DNA repair exonuclease SbcCD nuclease subunit
MFNGFDMVLMGDIHRRQVLQEYGEEYIEVDESEVSEFLKKGWQIYN